MNTCHTCAAFEPNTNECRRRAPQPMTLVAFDATATVNAGAVWPVVKPDDWCAEWISRQSKEHRGPHLWALDNAVLNLRD